MNFILFYNIIPILLRIIFTIILTMINGWSFVEGIRLFDFRQIFVNLNNQ